MIVMSTLSCSRSFVSVERYQNVLCFRFCPIRHDTTFLGSAFAEEADTWYAFLTLILSQTPDLKYSKIWGVVAELALLLPCLSSTYLQSKRGQKVRQLSRLGSMIVPLSISLKSSNQLTVRCPRPFVMLSCPLSIFRERTSSMALVLMEICKRSRFLGPVLPV
ncbi:hypothetical protein CPB84DRAFT_129495 [Gymnopilus junonius]|uniref:Uncharacterized protein n=1 Tax=Gymnopilus junonius TaxID=109634 RepID=A0A9P5NHN9_GYMJU|nr:hypothetical protein CPB84DRAFT_129495 [Gymnopilus junonius]